MHSAGQEHFAESVGMNRRYAAARQVGHTIGAEVIVTFSSTGSTTLRLDALPLSGTLQVRDPEPRPVPAPGGAQ